MKLVSFFIMGFIIIKSFAIDLSSHILEEETTIKNYFTHLDFSPKLSGLQEVDAIYVINLDDRKEKWEDTCQKLAKYDVKFNRFPAIAGWKIPKDTWTRLWKEQGLDPEKPTLKHGKLGCILSHLSALQDAYDRGFKRVWILQDDIDIFDDLALIDEYIKELDQIDPNWGLLFTDLDMRAYKNEASPLRSLCITGAYRKNQQTMPETWYQVREDIGKNFQKIRSRYGFHSVIVSRTGMEQILNYFKHVILFSAFDIDIHFIPNLNKYGLKKPLISNSSDWLMSDTQKTDNHTLENMPSPYNQLPKILPYYDPSYYGNADLLEKTVIRNKPKVIVELGSTFGKSTTHLAKKMIPEGKLYAIGQWTSDNFKKVSFEQFLSNVIQDNLINKIIPLKMDIKEAIQKLKEEKIEIDFLYIDSSYPGNNIYEVLCALYPLVNKTGVICGNVLDNKELDTPFRQGLARFAKERKMSVKNLSSRTFWMLKSN